MCSTCFGHYYIHHQELATILLNYTTLVVLFLVRCVLEFRSGWVGVVSVLQAEAQASDINLVFYSSTITMMHGPINIRFGLHLPKIKCCRFLQIHYLFNCISHLPVLFNSLISTVKSVVLALPENQEAIRWYTVIRTFVPEHYTKGYTGNGGISPLILRR